MRDEITRHRRTGGSANRGIRISDLEDLGPDGTEYEDGVRRNDGYCHRYRIERETAAWSAVGRDAAIDILQFQDGPPADVGINGITEEALLAILIDRLERFQAGKYRCRQNAIAITKLEEALHWLGDRTAERTERGVEGRLER